jgi:hypothetical protein
LKFWEIFRRTILSFTSIIDTSHFNSPPCWFFLSA